MKNKCHKTHLTYYSAYESWYDKTGYMEEKSVVFRIVPYKSNSKKVTGCRELQSQTDAACSSEFSTQ